MNKVHRLLTTREDRIAELGDESRRLDYKDGTYDADRLSDMMTTLYESTEELEKRCQAYERELVVGDPGEVADARAMFIETWATAQAALSGLAWVARFNGEDAFRRVCNFGKDGTTYNMRDL